jgi:hypothetical protein
VQHMWRKLRNSTERLEDLEADGRIILEQSFRKEFESMDRLYVAHVAGCCVYVCCLTTLSVAAFIQRW